jgi:hypothetical protein
MESRLQQIMAFLDQGTVSRQFEPPPENIENIQLIPQPENLRKNLFPHQLSLVFKMEKLEHDRCITVGGYKKETSMGINSEMTGYGKTMSMIALLVRNKMEWNLDTDFIFENVNCEAGGRIKIKHISTFKKLPTNLILISQSILNQWQQELCFSDLKVGLVKTTKVAENIVAQDYDVLLVIPTMYNKLVSRYRQCAWKRFIFDEPGHIKVAGMVKLMAGFIWFVTATPNSILIQHRTCRTSFMNELIKSNIWDITYQFSGMIINNPPEFAKQSFQMPPTTNLYYDCYQPIYNTIKNFASSAILEMISGGNIAGAIEMLGGKSTDNIVELLKRKKTEELEEINAKINIYRIRNDTERKKEWEDRRERVNNQILELDKKFSETLENNCTICFENLKSPILEPKCQNIFCGECLLTWLSSKNSCPLCRQTINSQDLVYIKSNTETIITEKPVTKKLTKLDTIIDIISKNKDGKFIIFSAYDQSWDLITNVLLENNITFTEIRGKTESRDKNIQLFKEGKTQVMFLNTQNNASGVNLQESTDIILYHEMSENTMQQVVGRALRLGRNIPLTVHHLK